MADPFTAVGLVAGILGIVGATLSTLRALKEAIANVKGTSNALGDLTEHIDNIEQLLTSLKTTLGPTDDASLPRGLRKCLECLRPSLSLLDKACQDFKNKLSEVWPPSGDKIRTLGKIHLHFEDKQIQVFRNRIECHKATLGVALNLATEVLSENNREDAHEIKRAITATRSEIEGEIRGLKIALESLSLAELGANNQSVIEGLKGEHCTALEACLTTCKSAEEAVEGLTSFRVGAVQHADSARLAIVGAVGTVTTRPQSMRIGCITGSGNARQMVVQEVGADAVVGMLGGFWNSKPTSK